jgi:prepilin-type N-terminal cleavage/methylation domain-containing protein
MASRRGFTILELSVAMIILVALMSLSVKWVAATGGQRREARWRQAALGEAANVMERLAGKTWDELTAPQAAKVALSDEARQALPDGAVAVQVAQPAGDPEAKEIAVTVRWRPRAGTPETQVRLVAWKYRKSR